MSDPQVSVVMSVYNGARYLRRSVESIMTQEGSDFEFVIVNDGSTDESGEILAEYAAVDKRMRIINQANTGLTKALMRGCAEARGAYIARHDADDISLPGRLALQAKLLNTHGELAFVSCWAEWIGPEDEFLFQVKPEDDPENSTKKYFLKRLDRLRTAPL